MQRDRPRRDRPVALVTGGAGFIGAHLLRELQEMDRSDLVALDDLSGGFRDHVPDGVPFVEGSITDSALVDALFDEHAFDHVYHLAAYAAEGLSHFIRRFNYTNNLIGSMNLLNASILHGTKCFVFTSSIAVYGKGQLPMREDMTPEPEDPYGIAKYAVEMDLRAAKEMFGLDHVIFRPHNVYGEFQNIGDRYRNVVGIFMNQILRGEPMTLFGDGEQQRAFSYAGDIVGPIARAPWMESAQGRVFNVGADRPCTVNELAAAVAEAMGAADHPVSYLDARNEVVLAYSDHTAVRECFGDAPDTPLADGLAKMVSWVKRVGSRTSPVFGNIEVDRNMPPSWRAAMESG
ncbi:MAG: NAD-dependent epimerase/dehydratase family protein [Gemmatimonadota bacterium]|nr:UDP-glucose 4-epimerase [Gemmatimonadota bacterium]MDP6528376.1 NAD-dependent epimerase/dehydratase family protein [Gemmatimonadota bacterium]MDP6802832.1 NAD-dependent epimerase/dehydratase family protein [Gemmatimonadota bacterium]MDP7031045.1 NAD-dependent epimerase/dehydratase family protein [Gemmatimonadota bacterium]